MADKEKEQNELAVAVANLTTLVQNLATRVEAIAKESAPAEIAGLKRTVGELAASFEQMKGVTKAAIEERERERQFLVHALAGNHKCPFSAEDLESKPVGELRKLAQMAEIEDYSGKGGPSAQNTGSEDGQRYAVPRPYFEKNKEGGK